MTTVELIEKLKEFPPNYEILLNGEFGCCPLECADVFIDDDEKEIYIE